METGNPPSSILSALKTACSSSLSLASFCLAARWASDLRRKKKVGVSFQNATTSLSSSNFCLSFQKSHFIRRKKDFGEFSLAHYNTPAGNPR